MSGYVRLRLTSRPDFSGTGAPTTRGDKRPSGSSENAVRRTLDVAEVGGLSVLMDDIELVNEAIDDSLLHMELVRADDVAEAPESARWPGIGEGVGGP